MQVQIDELSSVQRKLTFTLPAERIDAALDTAYTNLRKDVRMKGFRQGKVPRQILEQRFARHIEGEVGGQLVSETFDEVIKEKKIEPVSQPIVEKAALVKGKDFTFSVIVEVRPAVEVVGWEGLDVPWEQVEVDDDLVERALESERARHGTVDVAPADHAIGEGDYVVLNATCSAAGKEDKVVDGLMTIAGGGTGLPLADAVAAHLLGLVTGGAKTVTLTLPEGVEDGWDGVEASVALTVTEVKTRKEPVLDDEFAKDLGFDDVAAMRADIQWKLTESRTSEARGRAAERAIKALIEKNPFDVPEGLVRIEGQALLDQSYQQMVSQGIRAPRLRLEQLNPESQARVLQQGAVQVRRSVILDAVATMASLEVSDADVDDKIAEIAAELGQQPAAVKGLLHKNHGMDELRRRLREDRALDTVLERANIVDMPWGADGGGGAGDDDAQADGDAPDSPAQTDGGADSAAAE